MAETGFGSPLFTPLPLSKKQAKTMAETTTHKTFPFVLHDETVNTQGFRMLTSGCNLEEFRKNPVLLYQHNDYSLPVGRWENIRIEGTRILADAHFDENDPEAVRIRQKVEGGFVRMASIGAWPPEEVSDAFSLMLPGQRLPTVTKWTAREGSVVAIGANHNALAFYDRKTEKLIDLDKGDNLIRLMDNANNHSKNKSKMSVLTGLLSLADTANEAELVTAVQGIIANSDRLSNENKTLTDEIDRLRKEKKATQKAEAVTLTDAAIKDGRYDASGKEMLLKLFDADHEGTKAMLAAIPRRTGVASHLHSTPAGATGSGVQLADMRDKSWDELDKGGYLVALRDGDPELYKDKFKQRFGVEPKLK
jgi:hypothetical protein